MRKKNRLLSSLIVLLLIAVTIFFMFPIALALVNSLKTQGEMFKSVIEWPKTMHWENYKYVLTEVHILRSLYNTFIITFLSIAGIVVCSALAGYKLSRTPGKLSAFLFFLFLSSMLIPFYSIMFSLIQVASGLQIQGSVYRLPLIYIGLGVNFAIFLYHGFVKSIPRELEESAQMDGSGQLKTFTSIIFPLLIPITMTIVILDILWVWNDFMLPLIMITDYKSYTLVLLASTFFSSYSTEWSYILSILVLTSLPVILVYLVFQKYIVQGIAEGAIKG
ncbi:raffinose/stachyose/melibiose transport system permease protein [Paenibacillus sp. UNC496MF]|uniref:carbohydrate ABC transporter permease n=1 Tax=Paenibacillus sp. UNC496MF TaxID=1502753 RepID=UPI0008E505F4|nr:carbohydrate ABC transporter permease [Paenibacillus sp. UNC496MF]SFJ75982.1 raffinose/stachyose/melibiose transport system permease protein [Paenibacillus sp. UNC496MF]